MRPLPLALLCLCLALPAAALAEDGAAATDPRFDRGSWEVALRLNPLSGVEPAIGYYLADDFSVIVHIGVSRLTLENPGAADDEVSQAEVGAEAVFNFATRTPVVPFVGAGLSVYGQQVKTAGSKSQDADATDVYGLLGVRFLMGAIASVNVYLQAGRSTVDDNLAAVSEDATFANAGLAYSLYF